MSRRLPLALLLACGAAATIVPGAHAKGTVAPFLISDTDDVAVGAGPGQAGRIALSALDFYEPGYRSPVVLTVRPGHKRPAAHRLSKTRFSADETAFTETGAVAAHVTKDRRGGAYRVRVARLSLAGKVLSDTVVSRPDHQGAAPDRAPIVGADGTIAQVYQRPPGDLPNERWLTIQPRGEGPWTTPVQVAGKDVRTEVVLGADGGGAVASIPYGINPAPLELRRFAPGGALEAPIAIDLAAWRSEQGQLRPALAITDAGTVVVALGIGADRTVEGTTRADSHLLLISLAPLATAPLVQDVGPGVDDGSTVGALDVAASGGDGATVLAGDGTAPMRVFDTAAAAAGMWMPSTIASRFVGPDVHLLRRHDGGLSAIWAVSKTAGGGRGRLMTTHRAPGAAFAAPHALSTSPRAVGRVELYEVTNLVGDRLLATYMRYGSLSEGDRAYGVVGRP